MQKLKDHILEYTSLLLNAAAVCAELDWLGIMLTKINKIDTIK
jgi:hypothetical protein